MQVHQVHLAPGSGHDERLHVVLGQLGGHADDGCLGDVGVSLEDRFDLGRRQVLSPPADHVLLPADEGVVAVFVLGDEVAGPQPTVDQHLRRLIGHLVVATHDGRVAELQHAHLAQISRASLHHDPRVVHVAELGVLSHRAERSIRARTASPDQAVGRLRKGVAAPDLEPEAGFDLELASPIR